MKQKQHTIKKEILTGQKNVFGNQKHDRENEKNKSIEGQEDKVEENFQEVGQKGKGLKRS